MLNSNRTPPPDARADLPTNINAQQRPATRTSSPLGLVLVNLIAPGSALILLGREWLGLAVAALFAVLVQMAIWQTWIIPMAFHPWIRYAATLGAAVVWLAAQQLLRQHLRDRG